MTRQFIALDLSEEQKNGLLALQRELKKDINGIKWVEHGNLHVTLKFLGEMEEEYINALCSLVEKAAGRFKPLEMSLGKLGLFPGGSKKPRIIWVGVEQGREVIQELWQELEQLFHREGHPLSQNPFSPHVTIGRIRRVQNKVPLSRWTDQYRKFTLPPTTVNYVTVYQSVLKPQGAIYTPLQKIYVPK